MMRSKKFYEIDKYMRQRYSSLAEKEHNSFARRKEVLWKAVENKVKAHEENTGNSLAEEGGRCLWWRRFWPDAIAGAAAVLIIFSTVTYTSSESSLAVALRPGLSRMAEEFNIEALDRGIKEAGNSLLELKFGINR